MSKIELQTKRKIMRKLNLYGVRDPKLEEKDSKLIATVYVDESKKVIVEAEDPKVREDLLKAIYWRGKDEVPAFILKGGPPTEELRRKEREEGGESLWATGVKPGDPKFLEGLYHGIRRGSRRKFGDYYIYWYDIVEE